MTQLMTAVPPTPKLWIALYDVLYAVITGQGFVEEYLTPPERYEILLNTVTDLFLRAVGAAERKHGLDEYRRRCTMVMNIWYFAVGRKEQKDEHPPFSAMVESTFRERRRLSCRSACRLLPEDVTELVIAQL